MNYNPQCIWSKNQILNFITCQLSLKDKRRIFSELRQYISQANDNKSLQDIDFLKKNYNDLFLPEYGFTVGEFCSFVILNEK